MTKRGPQLPRIQPVGRAAVNPPHPHRDGDLAYGMPETAGHAWENWPQRATAPYVIASAAWAGYLAQGRGLTVDHLIPLSQGGASTWGNTVTACPRCNQRKADRTPHEAGMKLLIEPKSPRTSYLVASGDVPAAWKVWIEL